MTPQWVRGLVATAGNVVEYARFGGLDTGEEPAPHEVLGRGPVHRLRRYFPQTPIGAPPVLLVPPLMLTAEVWDVSPSTSAVALLHESGLDPWVLDFGDPGREAGGGHRTVTDHVLALSDAVDQLVERTGRPVHLGGYSQGGLFCYQAAALRGCAGTRNIRTPDRRPAAAVLRRPAYHRGVLPLRHSGPARGSSSRGTAGRLSWSPATGSGEPGRFPHHRNRHVGAGEWVDGTCRGPLSPGRAAAGARAPAAPRRTW